MDHASRHDSDEEIALIPACGRWARASAKLGRQVEGLRQALAREIQREVN